MGHTKLGPLPRTRKWKEVVGLIAAGAGADQIATSVVNAMDTELMRAARHPGLIESFWVLTQVVEASREKNFAAALRSRGIEVTDNSSLPAILCAMSSTVENGMPNNRGRTDLGTMAQYALVETTHEIVVERTSSLFAASPVDMQQAFRTLGTTKNFGLLGKRFFGRVMNKALQYFVSRESANHVGEGQRFTTLAAKAAFDDALRTHCQQAAVIVEKYTGQWLSARSWARKEVGGLTRQDVEGFASHGMQKLVAELKAGAA